MDCSQRNSGGIVRDLEVEIGNGLVPVDFHVLEIKVNWNSSLLLGRADITQITLRSELLSQIRGSYVVLRDQIHIDSRITQ